MAEEQKLVGDSAKEVLNGVEGNERAEEIKILVEKAKIFSGQEKFLNDEEKWNIAEQQKLSNQNTHEDELYKFHQLALMEEQQSRQKQRMLSIPPPPHENVGPPPLPLPVPSLPQQQLTQFSHILPSTPFTSSDHVLMPPPFAMPIRAVPPQMPTFTPNLSYPQAGIHPRLPPLPDIAPFTLQRFSQPQPVMSLPRTLVAPAPCSVRRRFPLPPPPPEPLKHNIQPPSLSGGMLNINMPPLPLRDNEPSTVPLGSKNRIDESTSAKGYLTTSRTESGKTQTPVVRTASSFEESRKGMEFPEPLERVLALIDARAQQLGVDPDAVPAIEEDLTSSGTSERPLEILVESDNENDDTYDDAKTNKPKGTKRKRKNRKRKKRHGHRTSFTEHFVAVNENSQKEEEKGMDTDDIEYVEDVLDVSDPMYSQFVQVFERFKATEPKKDKDQVSMDASVQQREQEPTKEVVGKKISADLDDENGKRDDEGKPKLSKRYLKKLNRMTVPELKQKVRCPQLVEMHDIASADPLLLLHLKAYRNTVPVPRHWCYKRKYLQGKRGIEKPPFELPDFIKRLNVTEMRDALQEKEDQKTMKAKMRGRARPKVGQLDLDYQKYHDAFFVWQTKPKMTIHGDLYYEGKEFEKKLKDKRPGELSEELRVALGMPTGPNADKCPPPWLLAMQRYGPPPSYPHLKIPGLSAPIPDGCSFGYHAGAWGKPPVDNAGKPLYGDVFAEKVSDSHSLTQEEEIDRTLWGELNSESSEEEEDEDEEDARKVGDETDLVPTEDGLITPGGFSTVPAGMETPDMVELRKRNIGDAEVEEDGTKALYTILPEKKTDNVGCAMMGSTHTYDFAAAMPADSINTPSTSSVRQQAIEVALDPSELEFDSAAMEARYEQAVRQQHSQLEKEDLSDMLSEHIAKQKNKRKRQHQDGGKPPKKYKEFKF